MDRKRQHCRAITSLALLERARAWLGIKDPPAGEGQVGQKQHWRAVTSLALLERARAWEWVKDPPAGEGQVGQKNTSLSKEEQAESKMHE